MAKFPIKNCINGILAGLNSTSLSGPAYEPVAYNNETGASTGGNKQSAMAIGYLIGRRIPKWLAKIPDAFLYNGVRLLALPELEGYSYKSVDGIIYSDGACKFKCALSDKPFCAYVAKGYLAPTHTTTYAHYEIYINSSGETEGWKYKNQYTIEPPNDFAFVYVAELKKLVYTNYNVYSTDDALYLAASDPIPVFEYGEGEDIPEQVAALISSDGYVLQDSNGIYLIPKEE